MKFSKMARKNFVVFSLVVMLGLVGYINYRLNEESFLQTSSELEQYRMSMLEESGMLTDLLDPEIDLQTDDKDIDDDTEDPNNSVDISQGEMDDFPILDSRRTENIRELHEETSAQITQSITSKKNMKSSTYFIECRLERDKKRGEMISHLNDIINNQFIDEILRNQAVELKLDMVSNTEKESLIEKMILARGFDDVIVYLNDKSINVIVNNEILAEENVVKIVDIIKRETDISLDDITIMNKK